MVRVWRISKQAQVLEASMKDHRASVNTIRIRKDDAECVSASSDGSCIIWDLTTYKRRTSLFANTFFKSVMYHPDESQLVTTGTDRKVSRGAHMRVKANGRRTGHRIDVTLSHSSIQPYACTAQITYWDAYDGQAIRIIDGSESDEVNALATDRDGEAIISGGGDKLVRVWGYDEGHCYFVGVAHSGAVTRVAVTPDKSSIVSVGTEGGIFVWQYSAPHTLADL